MNDVEIIDMCNTITSHPREVFVKNMLTLIGQEFSNHTLLWCELDQTNDVVSISLKDKVGLIHTFVGHVHRSVMDYNPTQLKAHFSPRIENAFNRNAA